MEGIFDILKKNGVLKFFERLFRPELQWFMVKSKLVKIFDPKLIKGMPLNIMVRAFGSY